MITHWDITGEPKPEPPNEDLSGKGTLTLRWYGSEPEVLLDGEPFPFLEWLCAYERSEVQIDLRVTS